MLVAPVPTPPGTLSTVCPILGSIGCAVTSGVGGVAGAVAGSAFDGIVHSLMAGVSDALKALVSMWTQIPSPSGQLDVAPGTATEFLRQSTSWYVSVLAIGAVLVAAARMALMQRGDAGTDLGKALLRLIFAVFTGVPVIQALLFAGDQYSSWILGQAGGATLGTRLTDMWQASSTSQYSSGLLFVVALVTLLATVAQVVLMLVRSGVVILLTGLWPLSASMSNTDTGRQWWTRSNGWLLAFTFYKPAAATVYATAFTVMTDGQDLLTFLAGAAMLGLAILTLPALLRLAVPAVAAASAGGGGGLLAATGGLIATGAMATSQLLSRDLDTGPGAGGSGGGFRPSGASGGGPSGGGRGPDPAGDRGGPGAPGGGTRDPAAAQPAATPPAPAAATTGSARAAAPGSAGTTPAAPAGTAPGSAPASNAAASGPMGAVAVGVTAGQQVTGAIKDLGAEATGAQDT